MSSGVPGQQYRMLTNEGIAVCTVCLAAAHKTLFAYLDTWL